MNKHYKNAVLGLLFALCLALMFVSISYLGVNVNAVEGEVSQAEETTPSTEETPVVPKPEEIVGDKYTFKDESTIEELILSEDFKFKLTITNLTTAETTVKEGRFVFIDGYYVLKNGEEQIRVEVDYDLGTFNKLPPITKDDVLADVEGLSEEVKKVIMIVVNILASFGITWASIGTIIRWFRNKTKDANAALLKALDMIKELKKELADERTEAGQLRIQLGDTISEVKELKEMVLDFVTHEKDKQENIGKVVNEIVNKKTGDE